MVNIISKKCLKCNTGPSYNYIGEKISLYCNEHKLTGMVDIISKKCLICCKQASFNYIGEKTRLYCNEHKLIGMVDIINKKCLKCQKQPSCNYIGEKISLYCNEHKLTGMVNIKSKKCIHDIRSNYCIICSSDSKVFCKNCRLFQVRKSNNYLCSYCSPNSSIRRKQKENKLKEFLLETYPDRNFINDKSCNIENSCQKYRPDFLLDFNTFFLIIECDEFAHSNYDPECERIRENNICFNLGLPCIFIRNTR